MSTIKSSAENLTLNADGANNDIKFQSNGVEKASIDQDGKITAGGASLDGAVVINESGADVDFRVESDTDANALFVQGSDGKVGIGVTALTRQLAIGTLGAKTDTATKYVMNIGQTTEASSHAGLGVYYKGHANAISRLWQFQPTENGVANDGIVEMNPNGGYFRANRGVLFNTDTAAANILDDYEEGAWTPTGTSSSGSWGSGSGRYVKIGSIVYCKGTITCTSAGNNNALNGFPFANSSDYDTGAGFETNLTGHQCLVRITGGGTGGAIRKHNNGNSFSTNDIIKFSITYTIV